jgi:integrase
MPVRTVKRGKGRWESAGVSQPLDRNTVSRDWHKDALEDAALRDMPLHALRHTAAAAWLAAGNSLMYVQRQLGHADISTTVSAAFGGAGWLREGVARRPWMASGIEAPMSRKVV